MVIKNRISVKDYQLLHKSVGWKLYNDRIVRASLKNSHMILSLYDEGKIIGMVRLVSDKATHGMITDMIVLPEKQGMGYGKLLLNELTRRIQDFVNDKDQFILELVPAKGKKEFYKKCGFKVDDTALLGAYKLFKNKNIYTQ
jgi:N-acetylglutamate synthase-like GNAT family acetyltransferase